MPGHTPVRSAAAVRNSKKGRQSRSGPGRRFDSTTYQEHTTALHLVRSLPLLSTLSGQVGAICTNHLGLAELVTRKAGCSHQAEHASTRRNRRHCTRSKCFCTNM